MAEEKEKKDKRKEDEVQKRGGKFKLIIIFLLVLILSAGGFFGWNFFMKKSGSSKEVEAKVEQKKEEIKITYPLKSFIVNLMDISGRRYLKVTMELETNSEQGKAEIEKNISRLRDTIIMILSNMSFNDIKTMEGKIELKKLLLIKINQIIGQNLVSNIYFTEFVVQ